MKFTTASISGNKEDKNHTDYVLANFPVDDTAAIFLEIASWLRLSILSRLQEKKYIGASIAKELDVTPQEVRRNLTRLKGKKIIKRDADKNYSLTLFGQTIYHQIPSIVFLAKHRKYFDEHNFGDIPLKFIHRIGELENSDMIIGHADVLEKRLHIYKNAEKYVRNNVEDTSNSPEIADILPEKLEIGIKIQSIFSYSTQSSSKRDKTIQEKNLKKFIDSGSLQQKIKEKGKGPVIILNEKEAGIIFPSNNNEPDYNKMMYSTDPLFYDWCLDYFIFLWGNSINL